MKHKMAVTDADAHSNANEDGGSELLAYMAGQKSSCGDVWQVLASKQTPDKNKKRHVNKGNSAPSSVVVDSNAYFLNKGESINFQGHQYTTHLTEYHYCVGENDIAEMKYAPVDRGANGGICGSDMKVAKGSEQFVDVVGLAGHKANKLWIVMAQALISTHKGDATSTFHQMALLGTGKKILSCLHMEAHGANINDPSRHLPGGKQRILIDGYQLPLDF
jgi:hypothetical protein